MSHTSIAATRDYVSGHDKGDLVNPAQSASFTTDPLLEPITTSALPRPMLPDPTPSDNPEHFDKSTSHPNTHYHPEQKLSKKRRAKKLGLGYVAQPHGGAHGTGGVHTGGRTFSEHDKEAHERAERRDAAIGQHEVEHDEEWETDEDDEAGDDEQSHRQHHENRITGTEHGQSLPASKRNDDVVEQLKQKNSEGEEGKDGGDEQDKDKSDNPSLMQRATNVLSSAQQKATGMATGVASTVMSTAQSVPVVGSLLSKVGLGAAKTDDSADDKGDEQTDDKADATADDEQSQSQQQSGQSEKAQTTSRGNNDARGKVGGAKEAATEATTQSAGGKGTTEAATKSRGEVYGKQGPRQDNHEGDLDKTRSHAGQKQADNMRAVNQQAKKEEEA